MPNLPTLILKKPPKKILIIMFILKIFLILILVYIQPIYIRMQTQTIEERQLDITNLHCYTLVSTIYLVIYLISIIRKEFPILKLLFSIGTIDFLFRFWFFSVYRSIDVNIILFIIVIYLDSIIISFFSISFKKKI